MHGLINRSLQGFVQDCYGLETWSKVASHAGLGFQSFEAMLTYPPELTEKTLASSCAVLHKQRDDLLGDLGIYLVSHQSVQALRRLLRFGGASFVEFLHSLDDLHERVRLAIPDLSLPPLTVTQLSTEEFSLNVAEGLPGFGMVFAGILRAMGDDYGALVMPECFEMEKGAAVINISVLDVSFAKGRDFDLAVAGG